MEEFFAMVMRLHPIAPDLQAHIAGLLKVRELKKKEFLLKKGQTNRILSFVSRGLLRCYYTREDMEVSNWFMKEGDFVISIQSFYEQQPSQEWIQALEDTELFLHYLPGTIRCLPRLPGI